MVSPPEFVDNVIVKSVALLYWDLTGWRDYNNILNSLSVVKKCFAQDAGSMEVGSLAFGHTRKQP